MFEGMKTTYNNRKIIAVVKADPEDSRQCGQCDLEDETGECPTKINGQLECNDDTTLVWREYQEVSPREDLSQIPLGILHDPMISADGGKKYDSGKSRYDLIPPDALEMIVRVLTAGAEKYNEAFDEENWRKVDHKERRYFGAAMRHMWAVRRGEHYDKETGLHHYAHAASNLMFLLQTALENKEKEYE